MTQKLGLLLIMALGLALQVSAQDNVPAAVVATFNGMFPEAGDVEWELDEEIWEVEFELGDDEFEASFDAAGTWLETEKEIDANTLTEAVRSATGKYPGYKIKEAFEIKTPEVALAYELLIKNGAYAVELIIDPSGKVLKTESVTGDDDDDEGNER